MGKPHEAENYYRKAIELDPKHAEALCNLGQILVEEGRFAEGLVFRRRGHEAGSQRPDWKYPSAAWVKSSEQYAAMEKKMQDYLTGEYTPNDLDSRIALANVFFLKKRYHSTAQLFGEVLDHESELLVKLPPDLREDAIRCAALAAVSKGEDAFKLDDKERARLRKWTLDWLRGELDFFTKLLETGDKMAINFVKTNLQGRLKDVDLAPFRDSPALAKLPPDEQKMFAQLWGDFESLRKKAEKVK